MTANTQPSRRKFLQNTASIGLGLAALPPIATARADREFAAIDPSDLREAVDLAIANVIVDGIDDVFPRPFEVDMLASDAALRRDVSLAVAGWLDGTGPDRPISPAYSVTVPKQNRDEYRNCTLIEPLDSISYLTLAILAGKMTSRPRSSKTYSYRFHGRGAQLFDRKFDAAAFQNAILSKLPENDQLWLVHTDIKNFYPSVRLDRLGEALYRQLVDRWCVDAVLKMLSTWDHVEGGLPIGPAASHILGEIFLTDIDESLAVDGIDHIRFVDDFRMFAPDSVTARMWLDTLAQQLEAKGLQLRPDKTSIDAVSRPAYAEMLKQRNEGLFLAQEKPPQPPPPCPPSGCRRPRRPPRRSDIERLKQINTQDLLMQLSRPDEADLSLFRLFIEASYWRAEFALIQAAIEILDRSPHCIPYFVDLLMQESSNIPAATRALIAIEMGKRLNSNKPLSDFETIKIAKLLGCEGYKNLEALITYLQRLSDDPRSPVPNRYVLEAVGPEVTVQTASLLADRFKMASSWERRAILRLGLPYIGESRSALAVWAQASLDPFSRFLAARHSSLTS